MTDKSAWANFDWKKYAADAIADSDVERAFYEQAMMTVANKCGALMQDGRHIGFEVVDKNDDDTRMVGIFVFRVSDDILYVPVFFINGVIKGGNSIYSKKSGTIQPLNKRTVANLLKAEQMQERGEPFDKNRRIYGKTIDLDALAVPRGLNVVKYAADRMKFSLAETLADHPEALNKLSAAIASDYEFASTFYKLRGGVLDEVSNILESREKAAAEKAQKAANSKIIRRYRIHRDVWSPEAKAAGASKEDLAKGFFIEGPGEVELACKNIRGVSAKGGKRAPLIYKSGTKDVDIYECEDQFFKERYPSSIGAAKYITWGCVLLDTGDKLVRSSGYDYANNIQFAEDAERLVKGKFFENRRGTLDLGPGFYVFLNEDGGYVGPIEVTDTKRIDGVVTYFINNNFYNKISRLRINPESDKDCAKTSTLSGKRWAAVKLRDLPDKNEEFSENELMVGEMPLSLDEALDELIYTDMPVKKARVIENGGVYSVRRDGVLVADNLSRLELEAGLCALGFGTKQASKIAESASEFKWPYKAAAEWPDLTSPSGAISSEFVAMIDGPQYRVIPVNNSTLSRPENPPKKDVEPIVLENLPDEVLLTLEPAKIGELAQAAKLPQVFDHALVGELAKTSGLTVLLDKHIPRLDAAVDSLGRLLFVLYWRPAEFEQSFGVDDMRGMENTITHLFEALGDLSLDLKARSDVLYGDS